MTLSAPAPAEAQETDEVSFEGSGWGHGVGMSQYGARAMAEAGHNATEIVEHYFTDTSAVPLEDAVSGWLVDDPEPLWVNLTGTPYTSIHEVSFKTAEGSLTFCQEEPQSVGSMSETKNGHEYSPYVELLERELADRGFLSADLINGRFDTDTTAAVEAFQTEAGLFVDGVVGPNTKKALWPPDSGDRCVIATPLGSTALKLEPNADGSECVLEGAFAPGACKGSIRDLSETARAVIPERSIRNGTSIQLAHGDLRIRPDRSGGTSNFEGLHVLVEIGVEDYVKGINEVFLSWPSQALQAQAIASRSYAVSLARGRGSETGFSGSLRDYCWCHVWSNTYSQVYDGYHTETLLGGVWADAVEATKSRVVKHPTAGLATTFYSSSTGGVTEANEDAWGSSPVPYLRSVADEWSLDPANPFASWTRTFEASTIATKTGLDELTGVGVVETNQSGSARTVRFSGLSDGVEISVDKSADWVRAAFGLRSNYFDVAWGDVSKPPAPSTEEPAGASFDDTANTTFEADIEWLAAEGVTKGCNPPENSRFCPDADVTRGQMAAFLTRFLDLPAASKDHFTDDTGNTFEDDINRLAEAGVTKGCNPPDNTRFCPGGEVTRGQMAAFLVRALGLTANTHPGFDDVSSANTFYNDIGRLATAGITKGCNPPDNTNYCPHDDVTRGQMAAFIHRADGLD